MDDVQLFVCRGRRHAQAGRDKPMYVGHCHAVGVVVSTKRNDSSRINLAYRVNGNICYFYIVLLQTACYFDIYIRLGIKTDSSKIEICWLAYVGITQSCILNYM